MAFGLVAAGQMASTLFDAALKPLSPAFANRFCWRGSVKKYLLKRLKFCPFLPIKDVSATTK
jgi:hypothetical protein